ncbi:hypothetical protein INT45_014235 [Circinella minor]|uniref:Uncharacterized protein n=1 Tax=Circinella minor TaxID=1195481 RepID=A0A8H7VKW0_9FUNG|nr:hypothetical protein INT45_014235 [Circinella minor]
MEYLDNGRLMIESSSGGINKHVQHISDDSLKLLEALKTLLKLKATRFEKCSVWNFTRLSYVLYSSCKKKKKTIALMSLRINVDKKYVYEEPRTITVPISYFERHHWVEYFELLAYLDLTQSLQIERPRPYYNTDDKDLIL